MASTYTDRELQRAKDVLESCDLVSPSTKGCYSSRIALWMHYCAVCCNGDEQVTGQRLADYVEWMVSSGSAERIRQGTTHIQQVLRNQLQGVLCYWRIQHANVSNAEDPRGDSTFKTKWQEIVMRYPSTRHSRRAEPIYGVPRVTTNIVPKVENPSAMGANGGSTGGAPYPGRMGAQGPHAAPGGYPAMRQPHLVNASSPSMPPASAIQHGRNPNYRPHPSQMNQPRQSSPMHGPHPYASQQGVPQRSWYQSPYDEHAQQTRHQSPSTVNGQAQYPGPNPNRSTIPGPGAGRYPQPSGSYGQQSQTVPERVPPVSGAYYPSRPSYPAAPQHSNPMAFQRQPASHNGSQDPRASPRMHQQQSSELQNRQTDESLASNPSVSKGASFNVSTGANNPETVSRQHNPNTLRMSAESDEGAVSGMSNRVPDSNDISRLTSDNATAVPSSPRAPRSQYILEGILPEEIPEWTIEDEEESAEIPEGHLLNQNESIALSIRQLGVRPEIQMQTRAHVLLGLSSWISASSRTDLTLSDIWTEEAVGISLPSTQPHAKRPDSITMSETDPDNESKDEPENGPENRSEVSSKDASKDQDGAENSNAEPAESEQSNEGDKEPTPEEEMTEGLDHQKPSEQQQENADDAGSVNTGTDLEKQADSGLENEAVAEEENEAEDKDVSAETSETKPSETSNNRQDSQQPLQPLRVLSIALHAPGNRTANNASANDKAFVLRHRNPLLCPWGALAFMLFSRWHVANEPAPDFSTSAWQSLKLFPELSEQGSSSADNSFKHLFEEALSGVTKDKLDSAKVMSDSGYFFADAFGLVRPTVSGIKGLDGVDGISTNTLLPEVLSALVRSNAGYPADPKKECTVPRRFGVMPPQSLQKEVFPWIKHLLIGAFEQNNNNDDVRSATRLLRVLRELRIVLLQDVAFLMEMPYLRKVIEDSVFFKHDLFASPDFQDFRQEMRAAVAETEIRDMETMCTAAVSWVKDRRIEAPDGSIERMIPTAPRLLNPETYSVSAQDPKIGDLNQHTGSNMESLSRISNSQRPSDASSLPGSHAVDEERKRQLDAAAGEGGDSFGEAYDSERQPKRSRRVYEMALTGGTPYRIYGDATAAGTQTGQPGSRPFVINSSDNVAEALNSLRMENDDLKSHVRKLEWVLNQHKAEVQAWMSKMEKTMQNSSVAASRQSSPHTRGDPVHAFRAAAPPNASPATASRQLASDPNLPSASPATLTSRQQSYHDQLSSQRQASQPSTPQTRYGDGQFQQPIKHAPGLRAQSSLHGVRETAGYYERTPIDGVKPRQPHQIPTQPIASNGIPVQQHYGKHQDYREPPMRAQMSPRGQGYGQRPPQSEYSEYRTMRPHDAPGYGEQGWYPGSFDEPVYPARQ